jgi:hypothetical protein
MPSSQRGPLYRDLKAAREIATTTAGMTAVAKAAAARASSLIPKKEQANSNNIFKKKKKRAGTHFLKPLNLLFFFFSSLSPFYVCPFFFFFLNFLVFALNVFVGQHRRRRTGKGEHFRARKRRRLNINVPDCFGWSSSSKRIGEIKKGGNMQSQREWRTAAAAAQLVLCFRFYFSIWTMHVGRLGLSWTCHANADDHHGSKGGTLQTKTDDDDDKD